MRQRRLTAREPLNVMLEHEPPEGRRRIAGALIGLVVILACILVGVAVIGTNAAKRAREANARAAAQVEIKFEQDQPRSDWSVGRIAPNPMETYPSWAAYSTLERPLQGKLQWLQAEISFRCRRRNRDSASLRFEFPANSPPLKFDTRTAEFVSGDGFMYPVRTRWDDGGIVTFYFFLDDEGIFRPTVFWQKPFIGRLRSHREVVMEVDFQAQGRVHFRWSLQGSSDAISEAQRECTG